MIGVGETALLATENLVVTVDHGESDHGGELAALVGIAGAEGVVVGIAGAEAAVDVRVELAHVGGIGIALSLSGNHGAASLALLGSWIPHAFGVAVARVLVEVSPLTFLGADLGASTPDAHGLTVADIGGIE